MLSASAMPYTYRAYGCNLVSDIALVRLSPGTDPALDTITVGRRDDLPSPPENATQMGERAWAAPNYLSLDIEGVVHFVAMDGRHLFYRPYDGIDDVSVQLFLMGSGIGAVLMQRKFLVMHGNAVEFDGACVMCVGPSGVGKSTTAAGLMQRGHRVMSDDICAIDAEGRIVPGMPHIKLWQQAADGLGLSTAALDRVRPELQKFGLPLADAFCEDHVPIKRVYVLTPHASDEIICERLSAREQFKVLRENTYRLPFVTGMDLHRLHFQQIEALSRRTTVVRLMRPDRGFDLDRLLDALVADATAGAAAP